MSSRKIMKIVSIFTIIVFAVCGVSYGAKIIPDYETKIENNDVNDYTSSFLGTIRWIGLAIAVGMLIYIGIRYIMSSADEKASVKGMLPKVLIGVFIIIGAEVIVNLLYGFN